MGVGTFFGVSIPVTGLNNGFLGQVSRTGERVIAAHQANASNTNNISFGDAVVLQPDAIGGTYTQVADWIANSSGLITPSPAPQVPVTNVLPFAGIAVREVKTNLGSYPYTPGSGVTGYYAPGQMCEVLERGSVCVKINVATGIKAGQPVYLRVLANSAVSAGVVGGLEAQADAVTPTTMTASAIGMALTVVSYTSIANGMYVSGFGIPNGAYVTNVNTNTITISQNTNAIIAAGTPVTFSWTVILPDLVFRSGVLDGNNVAEITILKRVAA